ncbi:DUF1684 domain-containing protein [Nocardia sp. CDC159]|uniref:DUF1684 domain-containing protein n=1 Tax=Nocardia pulmonis TaxID=2951408 RepID=A0A9X2IVM2_9NOCA|nr:MULTISPECIES: DUF1684 domain-containing protein [Nocardia]MCM6772629.1 DUF1684 domain-containing protein [Nocardia pulmonis]MCM6786068.1 DUF1684 domain-containing protein [Nocardia sp. CDC159]
MTAVTTEFEQQWRSWHAQRQAWAREPLGWLSLTGLHWLGERDEVVDGLPGRWRVGGDSVVVTSEPADGLRIDGETLGGRTELTPGEGAPGLEVRVGARSIEVIRRTGRFALRVHDPAAPTLAAFTEIPTYPPDPRWAVIGTLERYDSARTVTTGAVVEGLEHHHPAAGTIAFRIDGQEYRLIAFGAAESGLRILFTDATSGVTTYPGGRLLPVGVPDADGGVLLDFNRAQNLPCAFTDYATCPVAPAENRLPIAVAAGERDPRSEVAK